jgi:hypothetical protein
MVDGKLKLLSSWCRYQGDEGYEVYVTNYPLPRAYQCIIPPCTVADAYKNRFLEDWADMTKVRKPIIAAVSGYAVRQFSLFLSQLITPALAL